MTVNAAIHLAACRSDPASVITLAEPLVAIGDGPVHEPGLLDWPVHYAGALIDLGRRDEAVAAVERFTRTAEQRGSRSRLAAMARLRGEIATAARAHQDARRNFEDAVELGPDTPALERAVALAAYGRFLRRRGERRAAVERLAAAHQRLTELGATPFLARCEAELAACGVAPSADRARRSAALTPQEQIVGGLACRGLTNAQIARQLVLSVKTVGYHLSNVYTKLDVHSRSQLASAWAKEA